MTLVLTCLTPDFIVQASDRRVTRLLAGGRIQVEDDERNKAIVYKNVATLAYTGLAELGVDKRTDYWILYAINKTPRVGEALRALASSADAGFAEQRRRWPAVDSAYWRHAFALAGWGGPTDGAPIRPYFATVSNALDAHGAWIAKARDSFSVRVTELAPNEEFFVHAAGVAPRPNDLAALCRAMRRALRRGAGPDVIATHLVGAIRRVASWSELVGKSVLVVSIPKVSLQRAGGVLMRQDDVIDREQLSSVYYAKDANTPERYGPNFIYRNGVIMGEPVLLPPGEPEHGQEEPPWLAGPIVLSRRVRIDGPRRPLIVAKLEQEYPGVAASLYAEFRRRAVATPTPCAFRLNGPPGTVAQALAAPDIFVVVAGSAEAALLASDSWLISMGTWMRNEGVDVLPLRRFLSSARGRTRGEVVFGLWHFFLSISDPPPPGNAPTKLSVRFGE